MPDADPATTPPDELAYLEDLEVGVVRRSRTDYYLDPDEIKAFATRWDPQPWHVDEEAARDSTFAGLVACGPHLFCIHAWLLARSDPQPALIAGLGVDELRLVSPGRAGARLALTAEIVAVRPSASRPAAGIVRSATRLYNQDDETVMTTVGSIMVHRRNTDGDPSPARE